MSWVLVVEAAGLEWVFVVVAGDGVGLQGEEVVGLGRVGGGGKLVGGRRAGCRAGRLRQAGCGDGSFGAVVAVGKSGAAAVVGVVVEARCGPERVGVGVAAWRCDCRGCRG